MTASPEPLLGVEQAIKRYGETVALDGVDFELHAGEVHAVVGENGAGKSTLARLLAGATRPDAGRVIGSLAPGRARVSRAVAIVPQSLSLVGALTLREHVALAGRIGRFDAAQAGERLAVAANELGWAPPPDVPTGALSLPEQQLGELAVALALGAHALIVDEPTSSLGQTEVTRLIAALRRLATRGDAVVLITHRVREALEAADQVTVLRSGRRVHHGATGDLDAETLAVHMVGEVTQSQQSQHSPTPASGAVRLHVDGVDAPPLKRIGLTVHAGEILGVAGVAGSGQEVLAQLLSGARRPVRGTILLDGRPLPADPGAAVDAGVAYVPERRAEGLVEQLDGRANAVLLATLRDRRLRRRFTRLRDRRAEHRYGEELFRRFDVRPPRPELPVAALSGGNQQKLLLGRELARQAQLVVAHGPTQGLDLRAAQSIRTDLRGAASNGAAVIVLSTDLDEVLEVADRIAVLSGGRIVDTFATHEQFDAEQLGMALAGPGRLQEVST